jgi:transposase
MTKVTKPPYHHRVKIMTVNFVNARSENVHSRHQAISKFSANHRVSKPTIYSWLKEQRTKGFLDETKRRALSASNIRKCECFEWLIGQLAVRPTMYYSEMRELLFQTFDLPYSESSICKYLKKHKITRKVLEMHAREMNPIHRAHYRRILRPVRLGGAFSAKQLVYCDEVHSDTKQTRRKYGYAERGAPAFGLVANLHGEETTSCIATVTIEGILTATTMDLVNAQTFMHTLENVILPMMQPYPLPRSVLILDNSSVHNKLQVINACQLRDVIVLFLPAYSYDFNPIELCFHVAKNYLRTQYPRENHNLPLANRLLEALNTSVTSEIACNLFKHCYIEITEDDLEYLNR